MTPVQQLSRRTFLAAALATGASGLVPWSGSAATPVVKGRIRQTYLAAGGARLLGAPRAAEVRLKVDGHTTYGQRFARGRVWWGSGVGKVDVPAGARVRLAGAPNFRPVLGVRDVWRSDDPDRCTALDERILDDLDVGTMIAFNGGRDPSVHGVRRYTFPISNSGTHLQFYRGYVTQAANRRAIGKTLALVAGTTHPVLVHCHAGKDRTGWVSDLLQALAGVPVRVRDADYLATHRYSGATVDLDWLQAARHQLQRSYGDVETYLTKGCGLSRSTVAKLRRRLAAR